MQPGLSPALLVYSEVGRLEGDRPFHRSRCDVFSNVDPSPTHPFGNCLTYTNTSWSPNQGDNIQAMESIFFFPYHLMDHFKVILPHLGQWSSHLNICQNHLEGRLKHRLLDPTPECLTQWVSGGPENLPF